MLILGWIIDRDVFNVIINKDDFAFLDNDSRDCSETIMQANKRVRLSIQGIDNLLIIVYPHDN